MKELINNRTYNTDASTSILVKCAVDVEDLSNGYTRYSIRKVYFKSGDDEYFLYVNRTTIKRTCDVFDVQEYIVPVTKDWVRKFRADTPEVYPNKFGYASKA